MLDSGGQVVDRGRIEHATEEAFAALVQRWPGCRVAFEATMNWHWLYDLLEPQIGHAAIVLANPFKTRIIAEAQVKTDSRTK